MSKLNTVLALAELIGKTPEQVQIAEEKGELEKYVAEFNNGNKIFNLAEIADLKKNTEDLYVKNILAGEIPTEIYNKVKGTALEQLERKIKRSYEFEGTYNGFDDLVEQLITVNSKQPNQSKKEDLDKITELKAQLGEVGKVMQQNQEFKTRILNHENVLAEKTGEITQKYQSRILGDKLNSLVNEIPFADNDNEVMRRLVREGFMTTLNSKVDFKFNEDGGINTYDKQTNSLITDKVGGALPLNKVIEMQVKESKMPLKAVKQGDNIQSTTYEGGSLKTVADIEKHIEAKGISGLQEQSELYAGLESQ